MPMLLARRSIFLGGDAVHPGFLDDLHQGLLASLLRCYKEGYISSFAQFRDGQVHRTHPRIETADTTSAEMCGPIGTVFAERLPCWPPIEHSVILQHAQHRIFFGDERQ